MNGKVKYSFSEKAWQHASPGGWYFVSLPKEISDEIRSLFKSEEEGWGRLKAVAKIGNTEWNTAIWFDSKKETYLLPLKAEIRKKENIGTEKQIATVIWI